MNPLSSGSAGPVITFIVTSVTRRTERYTTTA
jgi:hypothetical protein